MATSKSLGKIFGKEAEAEKLISGWKTQLAQIKKKVGTNSGTRVFLYESR